VFFSPSAQQALRALIYLARQGSDEPVLVRDIAAAERIPHPFLSKLLLSLRNRGIVRSTRGPGGGYTLARTPGRIVLSDVVETFDGSRNLGKTCILGLDECGEVNPCALHERWKVFREEFQDKISSMTLHDVAQTLAGKRGRGPGAPSRSRKRSSARRRRR
jgi:Rrf2 family protein